MKPADRPRRTGLAILAVALLFAVAVTVTGFAGSVDRALDSARFAAWVRSASGRTVVVEMDAASAAAIKRWPWPRDHYAKAVDRLREAGAASVTFDVDLSSSATADGDAALAAALKRAEGLVALATFGQAAQSGEARVIDAMPLPMFREHVALASVSVAPDRDGLMRSAPFGTITDGTPRPSLSAHMARRSGEADTSFPIDFGIDPGTIPRLSFVAVRDGRFDPAAVRGREVIIGATAVEMGDRYATPHWGVIPGVLVQAMAAETLMRGVPVEGSAVAVLLLAMLLALPVLRAGGGGGIAAASVAGLAVLCVSAVAMQAALMRVYPLAPGLALLTAVIAMCVALHIFRRFEEQRLADEETGLPNRRALMLALADRTDLRLAVATIGNWDSLLAVLGEAAGRDLVLRLSERLKLAAEGEVYRLSDRLLGFELTAHEDPEEVLAGLRGVMLQPVEVRGRKVDAQVFVGLAEGDDLVNSATRAADDAVQAGVFWRHSETDMAALERQVSLMGELDQAIAAGDIHVHYQPKLALKEDRITSVEALVRWKHPERGWIRPDLFIPLAEQTDRIQPLTLFMLERVMRDLARWRGLGIELTAAVNISAKLVAAQGFDGEVRALLAQDIVAPSALILEVTESAALSDPETAGACLRGYRDMGVSISMDDYGTGQSTLSYIKQLPLSELKIDRSFVQHAHVSRADGLMVRSTVELAHDLGMKVVAEGIEDAECLAFLRTIGCDMAQGYLISKPLPAVELEALLGSGGAVRAAA